MVRPTLYAIVEALLATGLPVWLSFRRCRHGLCGVYGQHWGGPEGDAFGRAARRFEELGVGALLLGCIPPDHVDGTLSYLRDFTDLPLGVHPNLGYLTSNGWQLDAGADQAEFARMALGWREEGAQLIGGCCGVGSDEIGAAHVALDGTRPGAPRRSEGGSHELGGVRAAPSEPWVDARGRPLYPLAFPDLVAHGDVFVPSQGSFMIWRHLFGEQIGRGARCLDIGCGSGLQAIQLALQRRRARGRHRRRRRGRRCDAPERLSQRRGRSRERRRRRSVPVDARGALRRHRRLAVPGAGGPAGRRREASGRLLGPQRGRPRDPDSCPGRSPTTAWPTSCRRRCSPRSAPATCSNAAACGHGSSTSPSCPSPTT